MLYIKTKLEDGRTVKSRIKANNTFAKCSECGKEVPVQLGELFAAENADPLYTDIVCPECTKKRFAKQDITMEDMVLLATALCKIGFCKEVLCLYTDFGIEAIQELKPEEYRDFADALLCAITEDGVL